MTTKHVPKVYTVDRDTILEPYKYKWEKFDTPDGFYKSISKLLKTSSFTNEDLGIVTIAFENGYESYSFDSKTHALHHPTDHAVQCKFTFAYYRYGVPHREGDLPQCYDITTDAWDYRVNGRYCARPNGEPAKRVPGGNVEFYFDNEGNFHRDDGPAIEFMDTLKELSRYFTHGIEDNRVVKTVKNGVVEKHLKGDLIERIDKRRGLHEWFKNNVLHRKDAPARIKGARMEYYRNGKKHRDFGLPAVVEFIPAEKSMLFEFYVNDKPCHKNGIASLKSYFDGRPDEIIDIYPPGKSVRRDDDDEVQDEVENEVENEVEDEDNNEVENEVEDEDNNEDENEVEDEVENEDEVEDEDNNEDEDEVENEVENENEVQVPINVGLNTHTIVQPGQKVAENDKYFVATKLHSSDYAVLPNPDFDNEQPPQKKTKKTGPKSGKRKRQKV